MTRHTRIASITALALGAAVLVAGAAWATIPGGDGTIQGCYAKGSGVLW
jgi:hypothetical protein